MGKKRKKNRKRSKSKGPSVHHADWDTRGPPVGGTAPPQGPGTEVGLEPRRAPLATKSGGPIERVGPLPQGRTLNALRERLLAQGFHPSSVDYAIHNEWERRKRTRKRSKRSNSSSAGGTRKGHKPPKPRSTSSTKKELLRIRPPDHATVKEYDSTSPPPLSYGDYVRHTKFGLGRVTEELGSTVIVRFERSEKKLKNGRSDR